MLYVRSDKLILYIFIFRFVTKQYRSMEDMVISSYTQFNSILGTAGYIRFLKVSLLVRPTYTTPPPRIHIIETNAKHKLKANVFGVAK